MDFCGDLVRKPSFTGKNRSLTNLKLLMHRFARAPHLEDFAPMGFVSLVELGDRCGRPEIKNPDNDRDVTEI